MSTYSNSFLAILQKYLLFLIIRSILSTLHFSFSYLCDYRLNFKTGAYISVKKLRFFLLFLMEIFMNLFTVYIFMLLNIFIEGNFFTNSRNMLLLAKLFLKCSINWFFNFSINCFFKSNLQFFKF